MSYYEILGVDEDATAADIKSAYRRLVKLYHPDKGESGDPARFREIQEAYEILSDAGRRRRYDVSRAGAGGTSPVSWTGGFREPLTPFREVAPSMGFEVLHAGLGPPDVEVVIGPGQAARGGEVSVEVGRDTSCPRCRGARFDFFGWCDGCGGAGRVRFFERVRFLVPARTSSGEVLMARLADGTSLRARVRVASSR